jgi:hypothetical protein
LYSIEHWRMRLMAPAWRHCSAKPASVIWLKLLGELSELAVLCKVRGKYDDAERLPLEAVEDRRLKLGDGHPHTLESWKNLIELYEASGKPEKAEEWRAKLLQTKALEQ